MKERELRKHAKCDLCGKGIGHTGLPLFWRITVERFGINMPAVQRQTGLAMMIGGPLASIMGPDEDMAQSVMEAATLTVCESCATDKALPVAALPEHAPSATQQANTEQSE